MKSKKIKISSLRKRFLVSPMFCPLVNLLANIKQKEARHTIMGGAMLLGIILLQCGCSKSANILTVTDIHFTPYSDSVTVSKLNQVPYTEWDSVFSTLPNQELPLYNDETNPKLFELLLTDMKKQAKGVSAILFTGDILAHDFNKQYFEYTKNPDIAKKNQFIYKTVGYVSAKFGQTFPNTPIYFSLGNNDSYQGDYALVDGGEFLKNTSELFFENFIAQNAEDDSEINGKSFLKSYSEHGYYSQKFSAVKNGRIIGVNTIFFSVKYKADSTSNPGQAQLTWLAGELESAQKSGENVWLLLHIPPGVNVYTTQHESDSIINVSLHWKNRYNQAYLELMKKYQETIVASFAGHTHMDDFRLIYEAGKKNLRAVDFIHITPSVSPVFGNNPAYQLVEVDKNTSQIQEISTYYLDIGSMAGDFNLEYNFTTAYNTNPDLQGLEGVYANMPDNETDLINYTAFYPGKSKEAEIVSSWQWNWSGIGNLTASEYIKAYNRVR